MSRERLKQIIEYINSRRREKYGRLGLERWG